MIQEYKPKTGKIENMNIKKEQSINKIFNDKKQLFLSNDFIVCDPPQVIIYSKKHIK